MCNCAAASLEECPLINWLNLMNKNFILAAFHVCALSTTCLEVLSHTFIRIFFLHLFCS